MRPNSAARPRIVLCTKNPPRFVMAYRYFIIAKEQNFDLEGNSLIYSYYFSLHTAQGIIS